jgi:hypothetical protein
MRDSLSKPIVRNKRAKKRDRQLPTLPLLRSTIGARGLDFRVRDGNGYDTSAMATGPPVNKILYRKQKSNPL